MLTATLTALSEALLKAQLLAIQTLTKILETNEDPKELRRAATTLLKLKLPASPATGGGGVTSAASDGGGASPPSPDPRSEIRDSRSQPHHSPLLPTELADLRTLFPDVAVTHFTKTHSPTYWRGIIFRHATPPGTTPLRGVSPNPAPNPHLPPPLPLRPHPIPASP